MSSTLLRFLICLGLWALFVAPLAIAPAHSQAQSATVRDILARIDPKALRELLDTAKEKPDVALTNIVPTEDNKFRYVFVWSAGNAMTEERIGRSFLERFLQFASKQRYLATGYCLTPNGMGLVTATYDQEKINLAFRDIEVHRDFGWREKCAGKFITAAELEAQKNMANRRALPLPPPPARENPSDGLSPFLRGLQVPD